MNHVRTFVISGLRISWQHRQLSLIIYLIQLSLAILIGFQVYQVIEASIGHSASVEKIIHGYDHTVLRDLINVHGASLSPLAGQLRWILLIYAIYSVYLQGGILEVLVKEGRDWSDFWRGGARYFRPFMLFGLMFTTLLFLWSAVIWLPFLIGLFPMVESLDRERPIFWIIIVLALLWLLGVAIIFLFSINTRLSYLMDENKIWNALKAGVKKSFQMIRIRFPVIIIYFGLIVLSYYFNFLLEWNVGISSSSLIIFFIIWQQFMILFKIYLRISLYASLVRIHAL